LRQGENNLKSSIFNAFDKEHRLSRRRTFHTAVAITLIYLLAFPVIAPADDKSAERPEDWERRLERLRALPYLDLAETNIEDGERSGVVFHNPERAFDGYNLYVSRILGEAALLAMEGRVVHSWTCAPNKSRGSFHHVVMLEDGSLLVIMEYKQIHRIDWDSNLIWQTNLRAHHDVAPLPDGSLYVISRSLKKHRDYLIWFANLVHLDDRGLQLDSWSSYDHLEELVEVLDTSSFLDTVLDSIEAGKRPQGRVAEELDLGKSNARVKKLDYFHMNTVNLLPETPLGIVDSRFRAGNLLVCFRNVNQIAVLERGTFRPLWAWGEGQLEWPHHPTMLENGHILIFDNGVDREYSRVVELDVLDESIVWEYKADPPEDFYSAGRGSAQRLPNGNTLICESDNGRVFEVGRRGGVVWTWLNPSIRKKRREAVYRMIRLPKAPVDELLARK
jgi:hypothetical protein